LPVFGMTQLEIEPQVSTLLLSYQSVTGGQDISQQKLPVNFKTDY